MTSKQKILKELVEELRDMAEDIRGDWSDFDGRHLLSDVDDWLCRLSKLTGVEYESYYASFQQMGVYMSHDTHNKKCKCDFCKRISKLKIKHE